MQPHISIVVPIYNVEKYLRQCLDSIVNQTYKELEIILVDDGSPDSCGKICDEYASADDRIVVIHKENAGVSAARNDGIERARGEWVMFVDPDDWLEVDCCRCVLEVNNRINCDILYFQREINDEHGSVLKTLPSLASRVFNSDDLRKIKLETLAGNAAVFGFESGTPWGKLYRRSFLIDNSCRFPVGIRKRQDVLFNLHCLEHCHSACYFDYVGYHYRHRGDSICYGYNKDMVEILLDFYAKAEEFVVKYHKDDECCERMLGILAIRIHGDLRKTTFFNAAGFMSIKEFLTYMNMFYDDPAVKRYLNKPRISDFRLFRDKLLYVMIAKRHVYLYYCICASIIRLKLIR